MICSIKGDQSANFMAERAQNQERRGRVRVETYLPARILKLYEKELEQWRSRITLVPAISDGILRSQARFEDLRVKLLGSRPSIKDVSEAILALESKINQVLQIMQYQGSNSKEKLEPLRMDLSALGMRFASDHDFAVDATVGVEIQGIDELPVPVEAIGQVIRVDDGQGWGTIKKVAVNFVSIRESDRERIVMYIFRLLRQNLQRSREETFK